MNYTEQKILKLQKDNQMLRERILLIQKYCKDSEHRCKLLGLKVGISTLKNRSVYKDREL